MKYIGRDKEQNLLTNWIEERAQDSPNLAIISGTAGTGKSTFLNNFSNSLKEYSYNVISVNYNGMPYAPYSPLDQVFQAFLKPPFKLHPQLQYAAQSLYSRLNAGTHDNQEKTYPKRIFFYREYLLFLSSIVKSFPEDNSTPLVIMIDDAEYMARCAVEMLAYLVAKTGHLPLVWILSMESGADNSLAGFMNMDRIANDHQSRKRFLQIHLQGLDEDDVIEAFPHISNPVTQEHIQKICIKCDGNPLFITELLNHYIIDLNINIEKEINNMDLIGTLPVPDTLEGVFELRYQRADETMRRMMWLVVAAGHSMDPSLFYDELGFSEVEAGDALRVLMDKGLLVESLVKNGHGYALYHAEWRRHIERKIPVEFSGKVRDIVIHRLGLEFTDGSREYGFTLAHMMDIRVSPAGALGYCMWAAEEALRIYDVFEGVRFFRKWLQAWMSQDSGERIKLVARKQRMEVMRKLGSLYIQINDYDGALATLKEYISESNAINDVENLVRGYLLLASVYWDQSRFDRSLELYEHALSISLDAEYMEGAAECYYHMGIIYSVWENYPKSRESFLDAISPAVNLDKFRIAGESYLSMAETYTQEYDYEGALEQTRLAFHYFNRIHFTEGIGKAYSLVGRINILRGEYSKAGILLEQAIRLLEESKDLGRVVAARIMYGTYLVETGKFDRARAEFEKSIRESREIDSEDFEFLSVLRKTYILCRLGNFSSAMEAMRPYYPFQSGVVQQAHAFQILNNISHICLESEIDEKFVDDPMSIFQETLEFATSTGNLRQQAWAQFYKTVYDWKLGLGYEEGLVKVKELAEKVQDETLKIRIAIFEIETNLTENNRESIEIEATLQQITDITENARERGDWHSCLKAWIVRINFLQYTGAVDTIEINEKDFLSFFKETFLNLSDKSSRLSLRQYVSQKLGSGLFESNGFDQIDMEPRATRIEDESTEHLPGTARAEEYMTHERLPELSETVELDGALRALREENKNLKQELRFYAALHKDTGGSRRIVFESPLMRKLVLEITRWKDRRDNILITGEPGSGKLFIAGFIHENFIGESRPFELFDCSLQPDELAEKELLGTSDHDSATSSAGILMTCSSGTVFLQRVEKLAWKNQGQIMEFLKQQEESGNTLPLIITTIENQIPLLLSNGSLLQELYENLSQSHMHVPPLRERKADFSELFFLLNKEEAEKTEKEPLTITPAVLAAMRHYDWPGNVLELRRFISDLYRTKTDAQITMQDIPTSCKSDISISGENLPDTYEDYRKIKSKLIRDIDYYYLIKIMKKCKGNISQMADISGLNRERLYQLMERYGLQKNVNQSDSD